MTAISRKPKEEADKTKKKSSISYIHVYDNDTMTLKNFLLYSITSAIHSRYKSEMVGWHP